MAGCSVSNGNRQKHLSNAKSFESAIVVVGFDSVNPPKTHRTDWHSKLNCRANLPTVRRRAMIEPGTELEVARDGNNSAPVL